MLSRKALYGLKSSGTAFRSFLAETLDAMGYWPSYADQDLWLRPEVNLDGFKYYKYILFYVNDVQCISYNLCRSMKKIKKYFQLKEDKIEPSDIYLGAPLAKMNF